VNAQFQGMIDPTYLPIVITGASGKLATLVIEELLARGVPPAGLIATTRRPELLTAIAERGVAVRHADNDRPETLIPAFQGARRLLLISGPPAAFIAGTRLNQHSAAISAARQAGVQHLFYTSAPHAAPDSTAEGHADHWQTEQLLKASGMDWTVLRHWEWPDWHLEQHWRTAFDHGVLYVGSGDGRISHVTREDTAAADAGALLADDVAGRIIDVTGPKGLTASDIAEALRGASGNAIALVQLEPQELAERLVGAGAHPEAATVLAMLARAIREGCYDGVSAEAERYSGRSRVGVSDWMVKALPDVLARPPGNPW
jgi:NAD(P)H dehydrogenase (quinone)